MSHIYSVLKKYITDDVIAVDISRKLNIFLKDLQINIDNSKLVNINHKIIGLIGNIGSGKSTTQRIIQNYYLNKNKKVYCYNFADRLKELCTKAFPLSIESFYGTQEDKLREHTEFFNLSGRRILQIVGTDIIRTYYNKNFWVECFIADINEINKFGNKIIICGDVRFENELNEIKKRDGIIFRMKTDNNENPYQSNHVSENIDFLTYDYEIYNDKQNIQKLEKSVIKLFNTYNFFLD